MSGARQLTDEELAAPIGTIPLPPEAFLGDLDDGPEPGAPAAPQDVAELDFLGGAPGVTVPLRFPFRFQGREVREIRVRPLTAVEMAEVINGAPAGRSADNMDFYAAMTGLPAAVLRALPGEDGEAVTGGAYDFLPRFMRGGASSPTREDGAA